jgi:hypothetical protein
MTQTAFAVLYQAYTKHTPSLYQACTKRTPNPHLSHTEGTPNAHKMCLRCALSVRLVCVSYRLNPYLAPMQAIRCMLQAFRLQLAA